MSDAGRGSSARRVIAVAAIFVLSLAIIFVASEWIARKILPVSKENVWSCLIVKDQAIGEQPRPGSHCTEQWAEAPVVDYRFNACGYRDPAPCGPAPAGVYRMAVVGSSFAMGSRVGADQRFSALLPDRLHALTSRKIDIVNLGLHGRGGRPSSVDLRFDDILAERPSLILWVLTPFDIKADEPAPPAKQRPMKAAPAPDAFATVKAAVMTFIEKDRLALLVRHFAYQSQYLYLHASLPQDDFGFLRETPGPAWEQRIARIDAVIGRFAARAADARIPMAITLMPNRAQAAMISTGQWPAGYQPYALDRRLQDIARRHGVAYLDISPGFRAFAHPERAYLPVDGHPNAEGHAIFASLVAPPLASEIANTRRAGPAPRVAR